MYDRLVLRNLGYVSEELQAKIKVNKDTRGWMRYW